MKSAFLYVKNKINFDFSKIKYNFKMFKWIMTQHTIEIFSLLRINFVCVA